MTTGITEPTGQKEFDESSGDGVRQMFDRIAPRYDFLNHILSLKRDVSWRRRLARSLPPGDNLNLLDLATGTADQLLSLCRTEQVGRGIGLDPSEEMLTFGRRKIAAAGLDNILELKRGCAEKLPFEDSLFDAVTISFGIRNVSDVGRALSEAFRVLEPGGRLLILEFSIPSSRIIRTVHLWYLRHILPRIGGMLSGDREAYIYLNRTIESFPYGSAFCDLLHKAGFETISASPLTFGITTLYLGDKPS